jgi:hypothetical protein
MSRPRLACCRPRSAQGPSRVHWFHGRDCLLTPGIEVDVKAPTHPAGTNLPRSSVRTWLDHPVGCRCTDCVYTELNLDRDDDPDDLEVLA